MSLDTAIYLLAGIILSFFVGMILFAFLWNRRPYTPPHLDEQGLPEEESS